MSTVFSKLNIQFFAGFASTTSIGDALMDLNDHKAVITDDDGDVMKVFVEVTKDKAKLPITGQFSILTETRINIKRVSVHAIEKTAEGNKEILQNLKLPDFAPPKLIFKGGKIFNLYQADSGSEDFINGGFAQFEIKYSSGFVKREAVHHDIFDNIQGTADKRFKAKSNTIYSYKPDIFNDTKKLVEHEQVILPKNPHVGDIVEFNVLDDGDTGYDFYHNPRWNIAAPDGVMINGQLNKTDSVFSGEGVRATWSGVDSIGWSIVITYTSQS